MLTIFSIPKAFQGDFAAIQRNAISSWARLRPSAEIILFGDDAGTEEAARELGVRHVPDVARNEFGTPLLNDLFEKAEQHAQGDLLCYVNADILLLDDFAAAAQRARGLNPAFLMVGRRWNFDLREAWDFSLPEWQERLRERVLRDGTQGPSEAIDYFVFGKGLGRGLLPLAIGRIGWDNYLIWHAHSQGAMVIDASAVVMAIHQNHDYSHHPQGTAGVWKGEEARRNRQLIGEWWHRYTIEDASQLLTPNGQRPTRLHHLQMFRRFLSHPLTWPKLAWLGIERLMSPLFGETSSRRGSREPK